MPEVSGSVTPSNRRDVAGVGFGWVVRGGAVDLKVTEAGGLRSHHVLLPVEVVCAIAGQNGCGQEEADGVAMALDNAEMALETAKERIALLERRLEPYESGRWEG